MHVDELTRALHRAEVGAEGFDPASIRRHGRVLRRRRRLAAAGGVAALAVVGGAVTTLAVAPDEGTRIAAAPDQHLSGWEREVLEAVPRSYASGGTVVVPGPLDPDSGMNTRIPDEDVVGTPRPLGWHGYTDPGYLESTVTYPRLLHERQDLDDRTGKAVVADNGETFLACIRWEGKPPCFPAVLVGGETEGWFYLYGLGTDDFLTPGSDMELFLDENYPRGGVGHTLIGGVDGTEAARVDLRLVDGSTVPATVDSGDLAPDDTLFWAATDTEVARVVAYDEGGDVVVDRKVRDCDDPVDCEVR